MNTHNNRRRRESRRRMESAFVQLLQTRELEQITVTDICKLAEVNRTTFYANYVDLRDLADAIQQGLEEQVAQLYEEEHRGNYNSNNFLKLFQHIYENQIFYKTYFKLDADARFHLVRYDTLLASHRYDDQYISYHVEFFRNGLNAVLRMWLQGGCKETPEEINEIIIREYTGRAQ